MFVDNIFLYNAFFLEIDVSKPLVNQVLWKERVFFLEANLKRACWSRMLLNIRIKLLQVILILVVKIKIKNSSVKILEKRWQVKIF